MDVMRSIKTLFSFFFKIFVMAVVLSAIFALGEKALSYAWWAIFLIWVGFVVYFLLRKKSMGRKSTETGI